MSERKAFQYQRLGLSRQLLIRSSSDLELALHLDESLWAATVAPVDSFHCDPVLLRHLDDDGDFFVKAKDLKKAIAWTLRCLKLHEGIDNGSDVIHPDELNADELGDLIPVMKKVSDGSVSLEILRKKIAELEALPASASVLPSATKKAAVQQLLEDMVSTLGGVEHASGGRGITREMLKQFESEGRALQAWRAAGKDQKLAILGDKTAEAAELCLRLSDALNRFFGLCELVRIDANLKHELWPAANNGEKVSRSSLAEIETLLAACPIAEPNPSGILREDAMLNPFYIRDLEEFLALIRPLGSDSLDAVTWANLKSSFAPYIAWHQSKPETTLTTLAEAQLETDLQQCAEKSLDQLLSEAETSAKDVAKLRQLEKLMLFQQNLLTFTNNFVSLPMLYDSSKRALFEEGTLIIDGRRFNLAMRVFDRKEHAAIAEQGAMFVMYVEIFHQRSKRRYDVAVPATSGTQGGLKIGKRGIFEHVEGTEWTAQIVAIVDRPISLLEAVYAPFIRLGQALTRKIESITQTAEKKLDASGGSSITELQSSLNTPQPVTQGGGAGGVLAGGGIAIAALGSSLAFIIDKLGQLQLSQILFGLASAILAVLLPSLIIAGLRLRSRNISGILEGSRWGVNSTMRLSRKQQAFFTQKPRYPGWHF